MSEIIEAGRQAIPEGSQFRQMVEECIDNYDSGCSFEENWELLQAGWAETDRCPDGCGEFNAFNIDAKMNSIHILLGLLYGEGDFEESIRISMMCGDDSDCNPSSVGGILGTWMGYSNIPKKFTLALDRTTTKFSCTDYTFNDFVNVEYELAKETLEQQGVEKTSAGYAIDPNQTITPAELEQWPDQPSVKVNMSLKSLALTATATAFDLHDVESIQWDFGDGSEVETGKECLHVYKEEGKYTVTCTVTCKEGNVTTVVSRALVYDNIAIMGTPFAAVTSPTGGGSRDLNVMCDGVMPPNDGSSAEQYDTYGGWDGEGERLDYFGYTFRREYVFNTLIFQEGAHFFNGGWFKDGGPKVQVRQNGEWVDVTLTEVVNYPNSDEQFAFGNGFEIFTYVFEPITGDAIRIIGTPGGSAQFSSIAELVVSGQPVPDEEAIAAAEVAIQAIPDTIDYSSGEAIQAARKAVNALTTQEKELLADGLLEKLEQAEADYAALPPLYTLGDLNDDGDINAADALLALQHSVKLITLDGTKAKAADVTRDNEINASDALKILQYSVRLIEEF